MGALNETLAKLGDLAGKFANQPPLNLDTYSFAKNIVPQIPIVEMEIDEKSTFAYQMQQQTNQIIEKSNEQIKLLNQHNEQLASNYKKLEDLYALKEQELEDAKQDAKKAKRYNTTMLIVALVSAGIALASLVATILIALL